VFILRAFVHKSALRIENAPMTLKAFRFLCLGSPSQCSAVNFIINTVKYRLELILFPGAVHFYVLGARVPKPFPRQL